MQWVVFFYQKTDAKQLRLVQVEVTSPVQKLVIAKR